MSSTEKRHQNNLAVVKGDSSAPAPAQDSAGSLSVTDYELQSSLRSALLRERKFKIQYEKEKTRNETLEQELTTLSSIVTSLRGQLDSSQLRNQELLQKYDELYKTSQYMIGQVEEQKSDLKKALEKSHDRTELDQLLAEIQKEELHLQQQLVTVRNELAELRKQQEGMDQTEVSAKLEKAQTVAELRQVAEIAIFQSVQLGGIRDQIHVSMRMMESILKSMRDLFSESGEVANSALSGKARIILVEQLKLEIEKVRKIDLQLADIMQTSKNLKKQKWD